MLVVYANAKTVTSKLKRRWQQAELH